MIAGSAVKDADAVQRAPRRLRGGRLRRADHVPLLRRRGAGGPARRGRPLAERADHAALAAPAADRAEVVGEVAAEPGDPRGPVLGELFLRALDHLACLGAVDLVGVDLTRAVAPEVDRVARPLSPFFFPGAAPRAAGAAPARFFAEFFVFGGSPFASFSSFSFCFCASLASFSICSSFSSAAISAGLR